MDALPRRFQLVRGQDVTGVSGTGIVAHGVLWPDGTVTLRWLGQHASTVIWATLEDAVAVHGHDGRTQVEWLDDEAGQSVGTVPASTTTANPLAGHVWYQTPGTPTAGS